MQKAHYMSTQLNGLAEFLYLYFSSFEHLTVEKKAPHVFLSSFDVVGVLLVPVIYTGFFGTVGQVTVSTKSAKSDKQYVWEAEADTSVYTIREETDAKKLIPRGTTVTLHLRVLFKAASY